MTDQIEQDIAMVKAALTRLRRTQPQDGDVSEVAALEALRRLEGWARHRQVKEPAPLDTRQVFVGPRRVGKTFAMLKWMREAPEGEHRVCVSVSKDEAMRLLRENPDLESWQFVSSDEIGRGTWSGVLFGRGGHISLGVDNADWLFERFFGHHVGAVSINAVSINGVEYPAELPPVRPGPHIKEIPDDEVPRATR